MLEAAARLPSEMTRCMASPRMMRSLKVRVPSAFFLMRLISPDSASILSAVLIETSSRSGEAGLMTKSSGTGAHRVDGGVDRTVRGLYDDRRNAGLLREAVENGHAVDAGHDEIEENERDGAMIRTLEDLDRLFAGIGGFGFEALALDHLFQDAALGRIVIDD